MWSDRDTEDDSLGFESYVDVLSEICMQGELAPLTLGIFGLWGSGKTSLMRMLKRRIDASGDGVKTLWFNAWRYEGREEAQSALIHAILNRLSQDKTLFAQAQDVWKRLTKGASVLKLAKFIGKTAVTLTPDLDGFVECFSKESEQIAETMEQFEADFAEFLTQMKVKHIVVFIDDLDRCSSQKVIETFETIKLFLNTPACTFVIGADAGKIEDAVGEIYGVSERTRRKDFLEKIIQVPFHIPAQVLADIACYVGMLIMQRHMDRQRIRDLLDARSGFYACEGDIADAIRRWPSDNTILFGNNLKAVREDLDEVLPYVSVLAHGLNGNPRQIKRFLNIVSLRRQLAKKNRLEIDSAILIKMAVLEYVWDEFFSDIVETIDPSTGHSVLIGEMLRIVASDGDASDSQIVRNSLRHSGLVEFITKEPQVTGDMDLNPYLFLAQTSLSRGTQSTLRPLDDKAKSLVKLIESEDSLRTRTAAHQAAAQDGALAASVTRSLLADLPQASSLVQANVLNGLSTICQKHPDQFAAVVKCLNQLQPKQSEAVLLSASTLLHAARNSGVEVADELIGKFTSSSKVAAALATGKRRGNSGAKRTD
jgi:hypothetical protein